MDRYPEDAELKQIAEWDYHDFEGLLEFAGSLWKYPDRFEVFAADSQNDDLGTRYELSTGGWSGNESIVEALERNAMFWAVCWQQSRRGGYFVFKVPKKPAEG